ncbi:MAG: pyridoxamine 5'-phosphate oxidase family protein, partial [Candidatus Saccharimonadales bacterium]
IYDFLFESSIGVLSSTDPNGDPHGAVIYFTITKDFEVAILTKSGTRKYDNLMRNSHVMLTVFDSKTQSTAQLTGIAHEVKNGFDMNAIAARIQGTSLKTSETGLAPLSKLEAGSFVAFRIEPVQVRMAVYASSGAGNHAQLFETVETFDRNKFTG